MLDTKYNHHDFCTGIAHQKYLNAEDGIQDSYDTGCSHWYVDGSLIGEMVHDWTNDRIDNLNSLIAKFDVNPIFHGNFKAPLASDVEDFRVAAVQYVKKEVDISAAIKAPLIIHGGCIVEPKHIVNAKKNALDNYVKSVIELAEYAGERGVDLYLENLSNYKHYRPFHYMFTHMDEYSFVLDKLSSYNNIFLFLDIGHANICDGNPLEVIQKFNNKIKGISFSNNNGQQDQHLGISDGSLDYKEIMKEIYIQKWKGLIAFETRNQSAKNAFQALSNFYLEAKQQTTPENIYIQN